jgi:enoyl-CoA hydratase/methylglutaconyl-CoA hydratase
VVLADEIVHLHVGDAVATVTLDSPANRNALSRRLVDELGRCLACAAADESVRVVVLQSADAVFCAGADLGEALEHGMADAARALVALQRRIVALPIPVLARVGGPVRGGGLGLVAAADIVVAARSATFALTEVRLGLAPAVVSLTLVPRVSARGLSSAALSGAVFGADEAAAMGLVTTVAADDDVDAAVSEAVAALRRGAAQGLRETKTLLNAPVLARIDALGEEMAEQSAALFGSEPARAAMRAFLDR